MHDWMDSICYQEQPEYQELQKRGRRARDRLLVLEHALERIAPEDFAALWKDLEAARAEMREISREWISHMFNK